MIRVPFRLEAGHKVVVVVGMVGKCRTAETATTAQRVWVHKAAGKGGRMVGGRWVACEIGRSTDHHVTRKAKGQPRKHTWMKRS